MVLARGRKFSALPRTERQNPAGRSDPPDGVLLWRCYLSTDESRSVYPTAQIRQGADRVSAPTAGKGTDGRDLPQAPVRGRGRATEPTRGLAAGWVPADTQRAKRKPRACRGFR